MQGRSGLSKNTGRSAHSDFHRNAALMKTSRRNAWSYDETIEYPQYHTGRSRIRNINGTVFTASPDSKHHLKRHALKNAAILRKSGLLVRTIKATNNGKAGWLNFVGESQRKRTYFKKIIPFRDFQEPLFGIDTPRLVSYLESQEDYNPSLSWQENLRRIGGDVAIETLSELMNPELAMRKRQEAVEQEGNIATAWDQSLQLQGFKGYTGGVDVEAVTKSDPSKDIFDILGAGEIIEQPEEISSAFDDWFASGLDDWDEGKVGMAEKTMGILEQQAFEETPIGATPVARELNDAFSSIFNEAIWGEDESIVTPDGKTIFKPMLESDISPTLGYAQPDNKWILEQGGTSGSWTFIPNEAGSHGLEETQDTRRAWLVADSLGAVVNAYPYEEGDTPRAKSDTYEAIRQAYLFAQEASNMEPYTREGYQKHGNLSPGLAVLDGTVTINHMGGWIGWDINHRTEDGRLQEGDYTMVVNGDVLDQADDATTGAMTKHWVLPKWNPSTGGRPQSDPMRATLEQIIGEEGMDDAEARAKVARGRVAKKINPGASAQDIIDAMQQNRYIVKRADGHAITKYMPDFKTALQTMNEFKPTDVGGDNLLLMVAPSRSDGSIDEVEQRIHADIIFSRESNGWLLDYRGGN